MFHLQPCCTQLRVEMSQESHCGRHYGAAPFIKQLPLRKSSLGSPQQDPRPSGKQQKHPLHRPEQVSLFAVLLSDTSTYLQAQAHS